MNGRLAGLVVPACVAGVALGAAGAAHQRGLISSGVWFWLWPSLVALLWLALGIGALVMRWTKWAWPPLAGFVAQFIGVLLLAYRTLHQPMEVLWLSLGTFAVVLLVILGVWLIVMLRTRALEKKLVEGGGEGVDAQALARIRKDMSEALTMLRRAGKGRNAIYELPWLLVMGRPQGGKTFAIKNSGLSLPVRKDWVKGAGGTFTADWFFTNEMIFLDTPGKWVQEGVSDEGSKNWIELLRLLRRHRGRRPLDGLVVVVPADDLLSKSEDELAEQAAHVREVIDLIHDELKFRFPVYLLVSKTDLVDGFVDFFKGLPANRKHQIFGWSHPDPNDREAVGSVRKAFGRVLRRMQAIRLEILARTASATAVRRLFFFTEEFRRLEDPLVDFAEALFQSDPYHETPVFRGFYFTSATQGEGAPLGQAMAQLARNLGVRTAVAAPGETEAKRSYFLLEMFRTLMVGDEGLVSRTAGHWLRRRRDTVLAAFLPATIALLLLFFALISFFWNRSIYRDAAVEIPKIAQELEAKTNIDGDALEALTSIDRLRWYHDKMTGFTLFRRMGMRQPGELAQETFRIFRDELNARVLRPTFKRAQEIALDPKRDFATRADVFYSVVWLRQGNAVEYGNDLKGFEGIWSALDQETQAAPARQLLVAQFEHLLLKGPTKTNLLAGFDLARVAEALRTGTRDLGRDSAISRFVGFQEACSDPPTTNHVRNCDSRLRDILNFGDNDSRRLSKNLQRLKKDLNEIKADESGAGDALQSLSEIHVPEKSTEKCVVDFETTIVRSLKDYYIDRQDEFIKQCRNDVDKKDKSVIRGVLDAQDLELKKQQEAIAKRLAEFNEACSDSLERTGTVDLGPLFKLSRSYRAVECAREPNLTGEQVKSVVRPGGGAHVQTVHAAAAGEAARPAVNVGRLGLFSRGGVPSGYNQDGLEKKKAELRGEIQFAQGLDSPAQRATKEQQIRKSMEGYADDYEQSWEAYLRSIQLRANPTADAGAWLQQLSQSGEWRAVLEDAAAALGVQDDKTEPTFSAFYRRIEGLANVAIFLNAPTGLGIYLGRLDEVGRDVARCQLISAEAAKYKQQLAAGAAENSLVAAESWVKTNCGQSLAKGALSAVLQRPLEVARDSLGRSADPNKRWSELVRSSQGLNHKFPFSGSETDDLATVAEVVAVLGGQTGLVPTLYAEKDKLKLDSASREWLDRAQQISSIFFDPGSDAVKRFNLKLTLIESGAQIEPAPAEKEHEWRLEKFNFAMTDAFSWAADKELLTSKIVQLDLLGENASSTAKITLTVGHLKSKRKGVWEPVEPSTVVGNEDGAWAPLRALAKLTQGAANDRATLHLTAPFVYKKKNPPDGKLTVTLEVRNGNLGAIIGLIQHGLPPAPAQQ